MTSDYMPIVVKNSDILVADPSYFCDGDYYDAVILNFAPRSKLYARVESVYLITPIGIGYSARYVVNKNDQENEAGQVNVMDGKIGAFCLNELKNQEWVNLTCLDNLLKHGIGAYTLLKDFSGRIFIEETKGASNEEDQLGCNRLVGDGNYFWSTKLIWSEP